MEEAEMAYWDFVMWVVVGWVVEDGDVRVPEVGTWTWPSES